MFSYPNLLWLTEIYCDMAFHSVKFLAMLSLAACSLSFKNGVLQFLLTAVLLNGSVSVVAN